MTKETSCVFMKSLPALSLVYLPESNKYSIGVCIAPIHASVVLTEDQARELMNQLWAHLHTGEAGQHV